MKRKYLLTFVLALLLNSTFLINNCVSQWVQMSNGMGNDKRVLCFIVSGINLFAGTYQNGIFLSTNNGTNWTQKNQGFNVVPIVFSLQIANNYIFAGTEQSVWRRSLTEIIGIQNISTEIPSAYSLSQNYPNPFNPTTNIKFEVARHGGSSTGVVKMVIFDVMGREVQTLVNERLQPGTYEASFDGSMLNSGVYFYKLVVDGFSETKRMILIK